MHTLAYEHAGSIILCTTLTSLTAFVVTPLPVRNVMPRRDIVKRITTARQGLLKAHPFVSVGEEDQPHDVETLSIKRYIHRTAEEIEKDLKEATKLSRTNSMNTHRFKVQVS